MVLEVAKDNGKQSLFTSTGVKTSFDLTNVRSECTYDYLLFQTTSTPMTDFALT